MEPWDPTHTPTILSPGSRPGSRPSSMIASATQPDQSRSPEVSRLTSMIAPAAGPSPYRSPDISRPVSLFATSSPELAFSEKSQVFTEPAGLEVITPRTASSKEPEGLVHDQIQHAFNPKPASVIEPDPANRYSNPHLVQEHLDHLAQFGFA